MIYADALVNDDSPQKTFISFGRGYIGRTVPNLQYKTLVRKFVASLRK